jgi:hypothetical protein
MADIRRKGTVNVEPGNVPKPAELMEVLKSDEKWSTYELDDGTHLRMRASVMEIWRVIDEYDADGNPQYVVKAAGAMSVFAPEGLKKGAKRT